MEKLQKAVIKHLTTLTVSLHYLWNYRFMSADFSNRPLQYTRIVVACVCIETTESPVRQRRPRQPSLQRHFPETGSQDFELAHEQRLEQFTPHSPSPHAIRTHSAYAQANNVIILTMRKNFSALSVFSHLLRLGLLYIC